MPGDGHWSFPHRFGRTACLHRVGFAGRRKADLDSVSASETSSSWLDPTNHLASKASCPVFVRQRTPLGWTFRHQRRRPRIVLWDNRPVRFVLRFSVTNMGIRYPSTHMLSPTLSEPNGPTHLQGFRDAARRHS